MAKGDGVVLNIIGLIIAVVSLFLPFSTTGSVSIIGSVWIADAFGNTPFWFSQIGDIGTYFTSLNGFYFYLWIIFPILFIIAGICVLVGIKGKGAVGFGAFIFLLYPIGYLLLVIIVPAVTGAGSIGDLFMTMQLGAYLMIIAGILCATGAAKNGKDKL